MAARALALCLAASLCAARVGNISIENNSEKLAKSLRRQLVQNNYDYISSESQESTQPRVDYGKQLHRYVTPHEGNPSSHAHNKDTYEEKYRKTLNFNSNTKPVSKNSDNIEDLRDESSETNSQSIDDELKDIVQGKAGQQSTIKKKIPDDIVSVEDSEGKRHKYREKSYNEDAFIDVQHVYNVNDPNVHTTTAKYKIFKVKKSYRRSGSLSTLIQEETPDAVSIVNVGGGPFPEFRLPRARRQYMQLPARGGAIDEDDELPPPPVNDTNTAEGEQKGSDEPLNIHADDSNKESQNISLVVTVAPDEIIVL